MTFGGKNPTVDFRIHIHIQSHFHRFATLCNALQRTATHCDSLRRSADRSVESTRMSALKTTADIVEGSELAIINLVALDPDQTSRPGIARFAAKVEKVVLRGPGWVDAQLKFFTWNPDVGTVRVCAQSLLQAQGSVHCRMPHACMRLALRLALRLAVSS